MRVDGDKVASIIREVAEEAILPRFRNLSASEIHEKGADDLVTEADREAEVLLSRRFLDLLPGSFIVGEETVAADEATLQRVHRDDPLWIIDPVDGTANFVEGSAEYGTMVSLSLGAELRQSWIYFPVTGVLVEAEAGEGAYRDGSRLATRPAKDVGCLIGATYTKFMPEAETAIVRHLASHVGDLAQLTCAASEYTAIAAGEKDFSIYYRMMPWDHAPGTLILREAGGAVASLLEGKPYSIRTLRGVHVVAGDPEIPEQLGRLAAKAA